MPAVPSDNRLHAQINLNYIIRVYEYRDTITVIEDGKTKKVNRYWPNKTVSAKTLSKYIKDEQKKISLFNAVLDTGKTLYTKLERKRFKFEFLSK